MASRRTSLSDYADLAIAREIDSKYDDVKIVADNIDKVITLADNIGDIGEIKLIANEIVTVASIQTEIASLATAVEGISALHDDIHVLNSLYADKVKLDSLFEDKETLDSLYADKATLDSLYADKFRLDTLYLNLAQINRVYQSIAAVDRVAISADNVDTVSEDIASVNIVSNSINNVNIVGNNIASVNTVSTNINPVISVSQSVIPNLAELLQVDELAAQVASDREDVATMKLAVEAIYDSFDDRFLGVKISDPAVDNDGNALVDGAMYFNSSINALKVYDLGNTLWITIPQIYLSGLLDVVLNSITTGDILTWNGSKWVNTRTPKFDSVQLSGGTGNQGLVSWDSDEGTLDISLNGFTLKVGQDQPIKVRNNSGVSITKGMAVMATGTIGNSGRITVAKANLTQANAKYILGVVTETIGAGADGFCITFGKVRGIQTNGAQYGETWLDGDVLYVKDSGNGALTKVVPTDSQVKLPVAIVVSSHVTNGTLFVRVNSIDENHAKVELAGKVDKNAAIVGGTATKITYDAKGLVTGGTTLVASDIPSLDVSKITTGVLPVARGGTGTSTSTGSGSVVLSVSPTLVTPVLGVATGTSFNSITGLSSTSPNMDGVASAGTAVTVARGDHIHPTDTSRQATITGAATTITSANLTVSRTLVSDTNGKVAVSNVTGVELGYLSGVTSSVQTQINSKAPLVSPTFTGTPVAPTASVGTNTTQIATTGYVVAEINKIEEW